VKVEQVDFISIVSQDLEPSRRCYVEALDLPQERELPMGYASRD
jgi:hypothetical protein